MPENQKVRLQVSELRTIEGDYQTLEIRLNLGREERLQPNVLAGLQLPAGLDLSREVILFGQAPIWLYCYLIHCCREVPWLGCYDARNKLAVVVQSRVSGKAVGDVVDVRFNRPLCPAILIGGPPDSGKSVLANALRLSLKRLMPEKTIFLCRANWDGEGNWTYEMPDRELAVQLVKKYENRLHECERAEQLLPEYFLNQAEAVKNIRAVADLVLVDVGGKVQSEKAPVVSVCTDYLIISRNPEAVAPWHELCHPTLEPIAVIHSVCDRTEEIVPNPSYLEMVAGPWELGETQTVPEALLEVLQRRWAG